MLVLYFASLLMRSNVMAKQNNFLELLQDPQHDVYYKGVFVLTIVDMNVRAEDYLIKTNEN